MKGLVGEHIVELRVADVSIDTWQGFRIEHDFASPADAFDMTFGVSTWDPVAEPVPIVETLRQYAKAREEVRLFVDGAQQLRGFMDSVKGGADESGPNVRVVGRDIGGQVVDESMPKGFNIIGLSLLEALTRALAKFDIEVVVGNDLNRTVLTKVKKGYTVSVDQQEQLFAQKWFSKVKAPFDFEEIDGSSYVTAYYTEVANRKLQNELKVKSEDTIWSWIKRLLKSQNVMGWFSADGKFIVGMPDYGQAPMFHATRIVEIPGHPFPAGRTPDDNNIEGADYQENPGQRYSSVYVFGRQGKDPIRGEAHDTELEALGVDRPCYHRDGHIKSIEEANRVAQRMLDDGRIKGTAYQCKLSGLGQGNRLYAFDTIWDVWDDDPGIYVHDLFYCSKLTQNYDENQGPMTTVNLQPRGCIEVPE